MLPTSAETEALGWSDLESLAAAATDRVEGPTNAQSVLRLFGQPEAAVRVTLYRDHHAWCPYCQKVWLLLEEKRVPYAVEKVNMNCYGEKPAWFWAMQPSGGIPVAKVDGQVTRAQPPAG